MQPWEQTGENPEKTFSPRAVLLGILFLALLISSHTLSYELLEQDARLSSGSNSFEKIT